MVTPSIAGNVPPIVRALLGRAERSPDRVGYEFLWPDDRVDQLTYGRLASRALALAELLSGTAGGAGPALLLYPPGLDYVIALFGCLLAGVAVVPAHPPRARASTAERERLRRLEEDARPVILVGQPDLALGWATPTVTVTAAASSVDAGARPPRDDVAVIQYTSGSTGRPKGVMVRQRSLAANVAAIVERLGIDDSARGFCWLPPYHDMGLISILVPVVTGAALRLMAPEEFVKRPLRWLQQVSSTRTTISGGPNFAYELCLRRRLTEEQLAALDLSCWRVAFNGSEPVKAQTMGAFAERFRPAGFRPTAFLPCYGLAEATLMVTARQWDGRPGIVSCGTPVAGQLVVIADPEIGTPRAEREEGEIWIAGEHVTAGYWSGDDGGLFAQLNGERFVRTGDTGYLDDGELFVTGRSKDVIVHRGVNHHAADVEAAAMDALKPVAVRAVAGTVEARPEPVLALVIEVRRSLPADPFARVRQAVLERCGLRVGVLALVPPRTIPRTTSGKPRRRDCLDLLLAGELDAHVVGGREFLEVARTEADGAAAASLAELIGGVAAGICEAEACAPDDSLLALGCDSVGAAEAAAIVEDFLGLSVPPEVVLEATTPRQIAAALLGRWRRDGTPPMRVLERIRRAQAQAAPSGAAAESPR